MDTNNKLLDIINLHSGFRINGKYYDAVDNVSFFLNKGEILSIVGESGCGKSTIATSIMGLHDANYTKQQGEILYKNNNLLNMDEDSMNKIRGKDIGMIFQDPLSALNPLMKIKKQISEVLETHSSMTKTEINNRVIELLNQVGINKPERVAEQYPHQLSGGMRQRVIIAIALACKPNIIIADEPTTALDVTIQAQILDLLVDIQKEIHAGIILITHDLGVVAQMADRVAVMYAGQMVEIAEVDELFKNPKHPYTRSLLNSIPSDENENEDLHVIKGMVPSLDKLPREGCRFADRIPWIKAEEHDENPVLKDIGNNHYVRCSCYKNFDFE